MQAVDFLSQVMDSPEPGAVREAVRTLQDIGQDAQPLFLYIQPQVALL